MDPRDQLRALPDGMTCTVCDEPVPAERVHLLARRDDLAFVQVECAVCGSAALEFLPGQAAPPISSDEVLAMPEFLANWPGDVSSLFQQDRGLRPIRNGQGA